MRRSQTTRRRRTSEAMSLEQLEDWIDHLDPSPLVDGVSMLDGYLTATIVGPCSVNPYEWMDHVLGPHGDIGMAGTTQTAAIMAVAARFNAVSKGLATAPDRYAPIFERTDDGTVLAGPWCMGFLAAIELRRDAWRTDDTGRPMLGPVRPGPEGEEFLRNSYHDIPMDGADDPRLLDAAARPAR
jgi:uncharacterized protein